MTELQQNRYDQLLRRVGDLKGPGSKVNDALTELFPVIDVERVPGELLILGGIDICAGQNELTSAVGQRANIQLFNPAGSGKIMTVTRFACFTLATTQIFWGTQNVALTTLINSQLFRDTRRAFNTRPSGEIRNQSVAAGPVAFGTARFIATDTFQFEDHNGVAVLSPGLGLTIADISTNTVMNVTFYWRERVAEPSELNL